MLGHAVFALGGTADRHAEALDKGTKNSQFDLLETRECMLIRALGFSYGWKSSDEFVSIAAEVLLGIVDGHATLDTGGQRVIRHDGNALVGAV